MSEIEAECVLAGTEEQILLIIMDNLPGKERNPYTAVRRRKAFALYFEEQRLRPNPQVQHRTGWWGWSRTSMANQGIYVVSAKVQWRRDQHGLLRQVKPSEGYVIVRRKGAAPFVASQKDWDALPIEHLFQSPSTDKEREEPKP